MTTTMLPLLESDLLNDSYLENTTYLECEYNTTTDVSPEAIDPRILELYRVIPIVLVLCYAIVLIVGWIGNGLVIYVVSRFSKMKTVTNMYVLNLAVSDVLFVFSLPFLTTTTILRYWVFDFAMCKIYFVLYSINLFTSVFTLTVMSADRYLAVCHPVRSVRYRTPRIALFVCLCIWTLSFLAMLPIILYSTTIPNRNFEGKQTCTISWPRGQPIPADKAFIWYTFLLGFAIPVSLLSVFYFLVVLRLRSVGPIKKSKEKKKSHRKVTRMVLSVIFAYVLCWLPYWIFQVEITFKTEPPEVQMWKIILFNAFTVLTYINSMLNPFLYAFLSDNFRKSFMKAFKCVSPNDVNKSLCNENSMFPRASHSYARSVATTTVEDRLEMSTFDNIQNNSTDAVPMLPKENHLTTHSLQEDHGFLKPVAL